jgi:predicted amidophosphoribosyltransferase
MARNLRYMETGVCALCGADVRLEEKEGRVVCEPCNRPTDNCTCVKDDLETRHESSSKIGAMRPGTSGEWIADPQPEDDYPDD